MYENVTRRHSSIMDPALFQRLLVRAKETKTRAWVYVPGQLPGDTFVLAADRIGPTRRHWRSARASRDPGSGDGSRA
jgi:hypothetical protein